MKELDRMITEARLDRAYYHEHKLFIDSAACAIRERALLDAKHAIERINPSV